jgi:MinD-like ATPase involved in chromosome partitioning or flagellar assembly
VTAQEDHTKVVTFYSYKGGVGRTMALVNTAHVLARDGWRVLMVDFDLEAPGMTHFFAREVQRRPAHVRKDALDLLLDAKQSLAEADAAGTEPSYPKSIAEYVIPLPLPKEWLETLETGIPYRNGRLDLIPATLEPSRRGEAPDEPPLDYLERLDELDLPGIFLPSGPGHRFGDHARRHFVNARFEAPGDILFTLREQVQAAYDIVMIDSRTGLNEISGFSIGTIADSLVICCGLNRQNVEGTRFFMERTGLLDRDKAKPFVISAGPIPPWRERAVKARLRRMRRAFSADREIAENGLALDIGHGLPEIVEIPYHPDAAVTEQVFVRRTPEEPISAAYQLLAQKIRRKVAPASIESATQHMAFLVTMSRPDSYADFVFSTARMLPARRVERISLVASFASACGLVALPNRSERSGWRRGAGRIPFVAAVAALRLGSQGPVDRAWQLQKRVSDEASRARWAARLLYLQAPLGTVSAPVAERLAWPISKMEQDSKPGETPLRIDCRLAAIRIGRPNDQAVTATDVLLVRLLATRAWKWSVDLQGWELLNVVEALAANKLRNVDEKTAERVISSYSLPDSPEVLLTGSGAVLPPNVLRDAPDLNALIELPLGFWPEPLAATLTAVFKGPKAIREILAWLYLARLRYGYVWRVLVDWRYFDEVKEHPEFQEFLRKEDEIVDEVEAAIDRGEYPL